MSFASLGYPRISPDERRGLRLQVLAREAARNAASTWGVSFGVDADSPYYSELSDYERLQLESAFWDTRSEDPARKQAALSALSEALGTNPAFTSAYAQVRTQAIIDGRGSFEFGMNFLGFSEVGTWTVGEDEPLGCGGVLGGGPGSGAVIDSADWTFNSGANEYAYDIVPELSYDADFDEVGEDEVRRGFWTIEHPDGGRQHNGNVPFCSPVICKNGAIVAGGTTCTAGGASPIFYEGEEYLDTGVEPWSITSAEFFELFSALTFGMSMTERCQSIIHASLTGSLSREESASYSIGFVQQDNTLLCGVQPLPSDGSNYSYSPSPGELIGTEPGDDDDETDFECDAECIRDLIEQICAHVDYAEFCPDPCDPYEPPGGGPGGTPIGGGPGGGYPLPDPGEIGNPPGYNPPPYDPPPGGGFIDPGGVTCVEYKKGNLPPGFIDPSKPGGIGAKYQKGQEMCVKDETGERICGKITSVRLREDLSAKICIEPVVPGDKRTPEKKCYEGEIQDIISQVLSEMGFDGEIIFDSEPECVKFFSKPVCFPEKTPYKTILKYFLNMCGWCYFPQFDSTVIVGYCGPTDVHWYFHEDEGEALGTEIAEGLQLPLMGIDLEYDNREAFAFVEVFKADYRKPDGTFRRGFSVTYPVPSPFAVDPEQVYFHEVPQGTSFAEATSLAATLARKLSFKNTPLIAWKVPINHDLNYRDQIHIRRPSVPFSQRYMITKLAKEYDREQGYYSLGLARYLGA